MMGPLGTVMITVSSGVGLNFNLNVRYVDTKCTRMIWELWQVNPRKAFRTDELNQGLLSNKS